MTTKAPRRTYQKTQISGSMFETEMSSPEIWLSRGAVEPEGTQLAHAVRTGHYGSEHRDQGSPAPKGTF
jgi:hypothetical protein